MASRDKDRVVSKSASDLQKGVTTGYCVFCSVLILQAVHWDFYCTSRTAFSNILRGLITGFLPSLLIILWQVRVGGREPGGCQAGRQTGMDDGSQGGTEGGMVV
jgi:hypothetical protein